MMIARVARLLRPSGTPLDLVTDGDLLGRYVDAADADAFAELVRRYASMVRGVCRRILGPTADADDAFQAAFLVLVRKAATVRPRSRVGHFLYGVAYRTAIHARSSRATRSRLHRPWNDVPAPTPAPAPDADQLAALDDELAKLSDEYRTAVVLCELDGLSLKEAARRLGVPEGTLASRLARGRRKLAERLTARGLSAAVVLAAAVGANAAVPAGLLRVVTTLDPSSVGGPTAELTRQVLKLMFIEELQRLAKGAVMVLLVGGLFALPMAGQAAPEPVRLQPTRIAPDGAKGQGEVSKLYEQLGEEYPAEVVLRAGLKMAATPETTVAFLNEYAKPVILDEKAIDGWVKDVAEDDEAKQAKAAKELAPLVTLPPVSRRLLEAIKATEVDDSRRRLARVLLRLWDDENPDARIGPNTQIVVAVPPDGRANVLYTNSGNGQGPYHKITISDVEVSAAKPLFVPGDPHVRHTRAVMVLEHIGTPEAVKVLKQLASGHDDVQLTVVAKAALKRLGEQAK